MFASSAIRVGEVTVALPDPLRPSPSPELITRPGVARYAGRRVTFLHVDLGGTTFTCPARSTARRVTLDPAATLPGGIAEVLELSPLPFAIEPILRRLPGLPTFYVVPFGTTESDTLVDGTLATLVGGAFVGAVFPDGLELAPWSWLGLIGGALADAGDPDAAAWTAWVDTIYGPGEHRCRILDHAGRALDAHPPESRTFTVRLVNTVTSEALATRTLDVGDDSDLEAALAATPGSVSSLSSPGTDRRVEIAWVGEPPSGAALPVHAIYETGDSAVPGAFLPLPATVGPRITVQVLELARWYPPVAEGTLVERFQTGCRVEPLVDGIATFQRMAADLRAARGAGNGAHIAAWTLNAFALDPTVSEETIVDLLRQIRDTNGIVRVLATKFFNLKDPDLPRTRELAAILLGILAEDPTLAALVGKLVGIERDSWTVFAFAVVPAFKLVGELLAALDRFEWLLELLEPANDTVDTINELEPAPPPPATTRPRLALFSTHPMRLEDNPLARSDASPLGGLEKDIDRFSVWHDKYQIIRRSSIDENGDGYVAYLGGVEINRNRFDSPRHGIAAPYHDVHARVTGPVVRDVMQSFAERWELYRTHDASPGASSLIELPDPMTAPVRPALHIAKAGRTYYGPNPATPGPPPFEEFAPAGDRGIYDTLLAAIASARDYIYIEDQYFTPNDPFFDVLLAARVRCKRLLIVLPSETDQPYGDTRRRLLLTRLHGTAAEPGWGDRMCVGCPHRRPILPGAGRIANRGRCWLAQACLPGDDQVFVSTPARVIDPPCWLWINGELMLARSVTERLEVGGQPASRIEVVRGTEPGQPRWGSHRQHHREVGTPVTFSSVKMINVHSKAIMIDDTFVSIGSANLNRRGFFSDGEITVFAIPQQLHAAPDNPARQLRTSLWAEHLGLPETMGPALLEDPVAAFDLFFRSRAAGNRFTPFHASDPNSQADLTDMDQLLFRVVSAILTRRGSTPMEIHRFIDQLWNYVFDPPSYTDPDPVWGSV